MRLANASLLGNPRQASAASIRSGVAIKLAVKASLRG